MPGESYVRQSGDAKTHKLGVDQSRGSLQDESELFPLSRL